MEREYRNRGRAGRKYTKYQAGSADKKAAAARMTAAARIRGSRQEKEDPYMPETRPSRVGA